MGHWGDRCRATTAVTNDGTYLNGYRDVTGRTGSWNHSDGQGNLTSAVDAAGTTTTYSYGGSHLLTKVVQPATSAPTAPTTSITYNSAGQVTSISRSTGPATSDNDTTTFDYSTPGQTVVTDPRGNRTTYSHDYNYMITQVTGAYGHSQSTRYTPDAQVAAATTPAAARSATATAVRTART